MTQGVLSAVGMLLFESSFENFSTRVCRWLFLGE